MAEYRIQKTLCKGVIYFRSVWNDSKTCTVSRHVRIKVLTILIIVWLCLLSEVIYFTIIIKAILFIRFKTWSVGGIQDALLIWQKGVSEHDKTKLSQNNQEILKLDVIWAVVILCIHFVNTLFSVLSKCHFITYQICLTLLVTVSGCVLSFRSPQMSSF